MMPNSIEELVKNIDHVESLPSIPWQYIRIDTSYCIEGAARCIRCNHRYGEHRNGINGECSNIRCKCKNFITNDIYLAAQESKRAFTNPALCYSTKGGKALDKMPNIDSIRPIRAGNIDDVIIIERTTENLGLNKPLCVRCGCSFSEHSRGINGPCVCGSCRGFVSKSMNNLIQYIRTNFLHQ